MLKKIETVSAPAAIGPYSQAVQFQNLICTSGQLPIDPATGTLPQGIEAQTRQSLLNLKEILVQAGSGMDQILKTTVFLRDMEHFTAMNQIYAEFFSEGVFPARSAVQIARLPKDALVEIEALAVVSEDKWTTHA